MHSKQESIKVIMTYDSNSTAFKIYSMEGKLLPEFENISSITLDNVFINRFGTITGTYNKSQCLKYYEYNVNKDQYPQYFTWCFSEEYDKLFGDQVDEFKSYDSKWLMVDGFVSPEYLNKQTQFERCFFQIRQSHGDNYSSIHLGIYSRKERTVQVVGSS